LIILVSAEPLYRVSPMTSVHMTLEVWPMNLMMSPKETAAETLKAL